MANTGKIFNDSSNVYQDEAKVLYNYYLQAAERIVAEEEQIERKIANLRNDQKAVEEKKSTTWKWFLTIILFFMYWIRNSEYDKQLAEIASKISQLQKEHKNIFRDYKVTKLGVAYVPVADQFKYEDKSFIVDYAGNVPQSQVTLQMSRQNQLLAQTITQLNQLAQEVPVVETANETETVSTDHYSLSIQEITQNDYVGKMDRMMRTIAYCMNDLETASVQLPLVQDNSQYLEYLKSHSTSEIPANAPVIEVFDKQRYTNSIEKFQQLNKLKDSLSDESNQFEDVLQQLISTVATAVQSVSSMKLASTYKMVNGSNDLLFRLLKAPYNHYSPLLEAEEIKRIREEKFDYKDSVQGYDPFVLRESSKVRYNLVSDNWTAEDGSTTTVPFGVHQIYEEIVAPVVQNLMAENRVERLKIYNHIHDQKLSYVNKWHQDVQQTYNSIHQESADIINNMQESLAQYIEAYNTLVQLKKTEENMRTQSTLDSTVVANEGKSDEILAAFELQAKEFQTVQDEFNDYMDRLQEDISLKAEEFGHVEYYDARLRDGYSNEVAVAQTEVSQLDERRKPLAATNPLLAKMSDLPPVPSIEDQTYEDMALNLPDIAKKSLEELDQIGIAPHSFNHATPEVDLDEEDFDDEDLDEEFFDEEEEDLLGEEEDNENDNQ